MALFRSANPTLRADVFTKDVGTATETMTIAGTVNKTVILLFLLVFPASVIWAQFFQGANVVIYIGGGAIGGFIFALITVFK